MEYVWLDYVWLDAAALWPVCSSAQPAVQHFAPHRTVRRETAGEHKDDHANSDVIDQHGWGGRHVLKSVARCMPEQQQHTKAMTVRAAHAKRCYSDLQDVKWKEPSL
jgi:hypothetical protein